MTRFFERNKRKSALAALLLLLGKRRDLGLLLLMVAVLLFVFVLPANFSSLVAQRLARVPGGSLIAAALGVSKPSFGELLAAFKAARNERQPWEAFLRTAAGAGPASSVDMVRGSRGDLLTGDEASKLGRSRTVSGILNQDDAGRTQQGVYLNDKDVAGDRASLVQSAVGAGFGALGGIGAFAARGFFSRGAHAINPESFSAAMGDTQVPGVSPVTVRTGRYSKDASQRNPLGWSALSQSVGRGIAGTSTKPGACMSGGRCAFSQLATGRSNAILSSAPTCVPGNGCPPEYAANTSGAVYDNNSVSATPQVVTSGDAAPQLDGITGTPTAPSQGTADNLDQQASQLQQQEQQCNQADQTYGPQEQALQDKIQGISNDANNLNCGGGGCSPPSGCQTDNSQYMSTCTQLNGVRQSHYNACPIMQQNGPYQPLDCSSFY